jgi:hypothetical protein
MFVTNRDIEKKLYSFQQVDLTLMFHKVTKFNDILIYQLWNTDVEGDNQMLIDANPRTWIGKGFGLPLSISTSPSPPCLFCLPNLNDTLDISPISIETTFSELFYQLLQQICDRLATPPLDSRFIRFSDTFYVMSYNRFEFLRSILAKFPFLLKGIQFTK